MTRSEHQRRYLVGVWAERFAAFYLFCKGYRVLERRYKSPVGEIDLIVRRGRRVAFVEVKFRQRLEEAAFSLTSYQQRRIVQAAKFWLAQNADALYEELSFDAVLLAPWRWPRHVCNGFEDDFG